MIIPIKHRRLGTFMMELDDEDWDKIKDLNLTLNHESNPNTKYCKSVVYVKQKYIKTLHVHRIIMGLNDFKNDKRIVNHIDGNGLNNKKENLEISSAIHNSQSFRCINKNIGHIYIDNSMKRLTRWRFTIRVNKVTHSKRFKTKEEAEKYKLEYISNLK